MTGAQENMALSFDHMESIPELDELRRESMMMPTDNRSLQSSMR